MCAFHPELRAVFVCAKCQQPICNLCSYSRTDGSRYCSQCATAAPTLAPTKARIVGQTDAPPLPVQSRRCVQHPNVAAARTCKSCLRPMCAVCDFLLPGNLHLCPVCVSAPSRPMSRGRKGLLIAAYAMAAYNTIGFVAVASGMFASMARADKAMFGLAYAFLLSLPSLVGAAIGVSCFEQRLRNPPSVWIAAIWNCLLMGIHLIFIVIGSFRQ